MANENMNEKNNQDVVPEEQKQIRTLKYTNNTGKPAASLEPAPAVAGSPKDIESSDSSIRNYAKIVPAEETAAPLKEQAKAEPLVEETAAPPKPRGLRNPFSRKKADTAAEGSASVPEKPRTRRKSTNTRASQKDVPSSVLMEYQAEKEREAAQAHRVKRPVRQQRRTPLRIVPIGGLGEIGKNCTLYEYGNDMFMVDCGLTFPDESMLGIDVVIPDFQYVEKNADKLRGIMITHGHEDHIGGLPYLLKKVNVPVYGTRLTLGLIEGKLKEHGLLGRVKLVTVKPRQPVKLGCMSAEPINVTHSIPDAVAYAIHTPAGIVVQTGDFKVDFTPIEGAPMDLARFGELGSRGVLALLSDSTNAEKPGSTMSERKVGESFDSLFRMAGDRRVIIATFASNIHRVQQIIDTAVKTGRKVAISGRSMLNVTTKAIELGYLKVPDGLIVDVDAVNRYPASKMVLITTGSQGEPMAALSRMAAGEHRKVFVTPNDFIIISATPIPGNEKTVNRVVNDLMKLGAEVIYEKMYEVHVSGHACQDEQRLMLGLVRPQFFMPVHGEFKHLKKHAALARSMGVPEENIVIGNIGDVIEFDGVSAKITGTVPAGSVMVDGSGVGDVGSIVLRDRTHLAEDGLIVAITVIESKTGKIVAGPDVVSRGFVYVREAEDLMRGSKKVVRDAVNDCVSNNVREWGHMKNRVKDDLSQYLWQQTKRSPMILPVILEV